MENQNPRRSQSLNSDIISTLPLNIIESILSLMPLRDALRTSVLSKKWRYTWRGMPKLVFTNNMVTVSSDHLCLQLKKYKLISAIFHVLLLHKGPEILKFHCSFVHLHMESEFAQIISYLARENTLKQLFIFSDDRSYKLPISFFSLQGLEFVHLYNCTFEPPLTFNGFSSLTSVRIWNVDVSAQMLKQFLSKCPLLEYLCLVGCQKVLDFVAGENKFTFGDLLQCVPLIQTLAISKYYMKVMYDNEKLPVHQTPSNFLDPEDYPDLMLDYLVTLEIENFSKLPLEMKFVKLIMAKSPLLKNVKIKLNDNVSVDEEMKMLKDMLRLPFLRASPCAELIIDRP
ncbi:putative F-box domain, FBD domain, leucine-rich repeat domain superfamily [Helianthus annuus]|nr:putative F-box domain, FBD domain, leucine-rich repeat domain superfamily [Helianthus annuus]KAJ0642668.1 putative F-box domain, FBD domain, leucine-rich repeat domain superfamily [Helianthus annuus]KAJ0646526.1 putative F-box domain, FBD domain, leucine-rich repeat domain superfamily [Helianthus annuus]